MAHERTENDLYEQVARYLSLQYPDTPYHFDLSGMWTSSHKARNLYGRLNQRAWPDLFVASAVDRSAGMFIELKREGTKLYKKDGVTWTSTHIAEQANMLAQLTLAGYDAWFACGFDEARRLIDAYLSSEPAEVAEDIPF